MVDTVKSKALILIVAVMTMMSALMAYAPEADAGFKYYCGGSGYQHHKHWSWYLGAYNHHYTYFHGNWNEFWDYNWIDGWTYRGWAWCG